MKPTIIEEQAVPMAEVFEELKRIKKQDKELSFRANKTYEYLQQMDLLSVKDVEKFSKDLESLKVPRLKDIHITKIIDMMPASVEELKIILQGYTLTVNNDNCKKIVDTIKKFA